MTSNIKTIRFTFIISLVFLLLTYIVSLNIEINFITFNTPWLSNNFLLTAFGGVFASTLVVLICEIQKYFQNKRESEDLLFSHLINIYIEVFCLEQNIKEFISDKGKEITSNFFDYNVNNAQSHIMSIKMIDYSLLKSNSAEKAHKLFCFKQSSEIEKDLKDCTYFKIAYNIAQMENIKIFNQKKPITAQNDLVNRTLNILCKNMSHIQETIDGYLTTLDKSCKGRYLWNENKKQIHSRYISLDNASSFEVFLKKEDAEK